MPASHAPGRLFARGSLGDRVPASRAPGGLFARGSLGDCLPVLRVCASVVGGPGSLVELGPCDVFGSVIGPARWAPLAAEAFEDMQLGPWVRRACRAFVHGMYGILVRSMAAITSRIMTPIISSTDRHAMACFVNVSNASSLHPNRATHRLIVPRLRIIDTFSAATSAIWVTCQIRMPLQMA